MRAGKGAADSTPWWGTYKAEFLRMLSFGELETYDHPVACARTLLPNLTRHWHVPLHADRHAHLHVLTWEAISGRAQVAAMPERSGGPGRKT